MVRRRRRNDDLAEFVPIFVANALPIAGIVWFDLTHTIVFLLYLFETTTLFVVYCGCALFAQQATNTEDGHVTAAVWGADDGILSDLPSVSLPGPLPPVYLRSLRVVAPTMLLAGIVFVSLGELIVGNHEAHGSFPVWLSAFRSPSVFGSALTIAGSYLVYVYRSYFRPRRYEELSPATVLEYPARLILVLFPAVMGLFLAFVLIGGLTLQVASQSAADRVGIATLVGGFFLLKTGLEWARFRVERSSESDDVGGFAAWLAPEEFRSKWGE